MKIKTSFQYPEEYKQQAEAYISYKTSMPRTLGTTINETLQRHNQFSVASHIFRYILNITAKFDFYLGL